MAKISVKRMSVAELVSLRDLVQSELSRKVESERVGLQKQIEALSKLSDGAGQFRREARTGASKKGRAYKAGRGNGQIKRRAKVAPKYRGPDGETWSGRGLSPRWLVAQEKQGKKRESFLIKK